MNVTITTSDFSQIAYSKNGTGKVLFLLHGFPESASLWDGIIPALAKHFTVIAMDTPGSGDSHLPSTPVSIPQLAIAIKTILDHEGITEAVLAGHSMGGYMALAFAEQYPSYVKGLSLVHSTATADDDERKLKRLRAIEIIKKGGKDAFMREVIPSYFSSHFKATKGTVVTHQVQRGIQLSDESMIAYYEAMMHRSDTRKVIKELNCPFQMIIGKEETIAPMPLLLEQGAMAAISFVSIYADCLHMSMLEQPDLLTNDLINFTLYCHQS